MFLEIQRDHTDGRVWRALRLVRGRRDDWRTQKPITGIGLSIWRGRDHTRAYLIGSWWLWPLPNSRLWPWLYDRLK